MAANVKPVVHYKFLRFCEVGKHALVDALNHYNKGIVSNVGTSRTSLVTAYDPMTGEFETAHTRYKPACFGRDLTQQPQ